MHSCWIVYSMHPVSFPLCKSIPVCEPTARVRVWSRLCPQYCSLAQYPHMYTQSTLISILSTLHKYTYYFFNLFKVHAKQKVKNIFF